MKKILSIFAITAVFAAYDSNPKTIPDTANAASVDTATTNQNTFTDTAREVQLNGISDTIVSNDGNTYVKVKPKETEKALVNPAPVINKKSSVRHSSTSTRTASSAGSGSSTSKSETSTVSNGKSDTVGTTTTTTTTETKKKGWSKAATGAVIGAGTGAAAGAIISKKKGKGAIIGGVIGATGGYILGRSKDKKDGRY